LDNNFENETNNNDNGIGYKINTTREYMVYKSEMHEKMFYKVQLQRKNYDGTKENTYKNLTFKKGIEIPDKAIIRIKKGFEDFRQNPNDKYNAIWSVFVLDFEYVENKIRDEKNAYDEYQSIITEKQKSPYDFENTDEFVSLESLDNDLD